MSASVVVVQTTAGGAGAPVAVDVVGTSAFQQVKLVGGAIGVTSPIDVTSGVPAASSQGLVVAVIPGVSVSAQVSGTVSVSGLATTGGTLLVTWGQSVASVLIAAVENGGTVGARQHVLASSATFASGHFGIGVRVIGPAQVSGTVDVGTVSVSNTVAVTLATGGSVTLVGSVGASLVAAVSISSITPVTTAASVSVSGLPVWLNPTQQVVVSGLVGHSVTGSVNIVSTVVVSGMAGQSVSAQVSGTVSVSNTVVVTLATGGTVATLLGTVAVNVVAGGAAPGSTAATQTAISGQVVWLAPTQTIQVSIVAGAGGGGSVTTAGPSISATGQVVWIAGGQGTTANPVAVTGNISVSVAFSTTALATTTQAAVTGAVVWLAPTQTMSVVVSGTVSVSNTVTVIGTANVTLLQLGANVVATSQPASNASGLRVWVVGGQDPTGTPIVVSGSIATVLGTVAVNVVAGGAAPGTTAATQSAISAQVVWLAPTQTASVAIINIAPVTTAASVSVTGLPVWLNPTQQVVVSGLVGHSVTGTISVLNVVPVTTAASVSVTGLPVWLNPTQQVVVSGLVGHSITGSVNIVSTAVVTLATGGTVATLLGTVLVSQVAGASVVVSGTVSALDVGRTQVMLIITQTSVGISGTMMLFTAYQGLTQSAAGTTGYIVPAGKTFRVLSANILANNSVTTSPVNHLLFVVASTAAPTWTSAVPIVAAVGAQASSALVAASACAVGVADVGAGVTVGLGYTIATSGGTIVQAVVNGYLFP